MTCLAAALVLEAALGGAAEKAEEILRRSDVVAHAPDAFRAHLRISTPGNPTPPVEIEVWRSGDDRTLVRFLGPKQEGKFLVRLGEDMWFLAPGAKGPVRMGPAYRLRGSASMEDVLGIRYSREYEIAAVSEDEDGEGSLLVFDLKARAKKARYPRVLYVVSTSTARPVRAEYRLRSGKTAMTAEFREWFPGNRPQVKRLVLRDQLKGGAVTEVEMLEVEERPVPEGLFDLRDPSARRKLGS